ncbi:MAG: hypothetical protein WCG27_06865 [Pseudomonadota bacterium]
MSDNGTTTYLKCYRCHKDLTIEVGDKIMLHEECPSCGADVHCCKMCEYYDETAYNECHEPIAERVIHKEKANFCDLFSPLLEHVDKKGPSHGDHRTAAESLFKK